MSRWRDSLDQKAKVVHGSKKNLKRHNGNHYLRSINTMERRLWIGRSQKDESLRDVRGVESSQSIASNGSQTKGKSVSVVSKETIALYLKFPANTMQTRTPIVPLPIITLGTHDERVAVGFAARFKAYLHILQDRCLSSIDGRGIGRRGQAPVFSLVMFSEEVYERFELV